MNRIDKNNAEFFMIPGKKYMQSHNSGEYDFIF